jgi:hypothetical protein
MRRFFVVAALVCAGCGGSTAVDFTGTYVGPVRTQRTCSVASDNADNNSTLTYTFTQTGAALSFGGSKCPGIPATISGDVATIQKHTCPSTTNADGVTTCQDTITGGTLTLSGDNVTLNTNGQVTCSNASASETCTFSSTGTVARPAK